MEALIKIHPEAIKSLVNLSWEYANNNLFGKCLLRDDEKEYIKDCIKQYYWAIPADKFCEISGQYFDAFCTKVLLAKAYFDKGEDWNMIDPAYGFLLRFELNPSNLLVKEL